MHVHNVMLLIFFFYISSKKCNYNKRTFFITLMVFYKNPFYFRWSVCAMKAINLHTKFNMINTKIINSTFFNLLRQLHSWPVFFLLLLDLIIMRKPVRSRVSVLYMVINRLLTQEMHNSLDLFSYVNY